MNSKKHLINLNNHKNEPENIREDDGHDFIEDCLPFTYLRVIVFVIILNIIFYAYWKIKICFRCKNDGTTYYGDTYITTSSHHSHHHHPHHHSAPHHSAPLRSAPHHSAPHHSAPHHSAPHHAPHRSAPHHSGHHGGHGRH